MNFGMPCISRFFGVVISIYYGDHEPAHFHARYAGSRAAFSIETLVMMRGSLPARARALVLEWAFLHRDELQANWIRAAQAQPLLPIEPLE
jgi:hypothetical protein